MLDAQPNISPLTILDRHGAEVAALCARHHVARLEVFGSAVAGGFDAERSDYDFLVEFAPGTDLGPWLSEYFALKEELEKLLGRPVDLVQSKAPTSEHFWREANASRRLVYAA